MTIQCARGVGERRPLDLVSQGEGGKRRGEKMGGRGRYPLGPQLGAKKYKELIESHNTKGKKKKKKKGGRWKRKGGTLLIWSCTQLP